MRVVNTIIFLFVVFPALCLAGTLTERESGSLSVRHVPNPVPVYIVPDSTERHGSYRWRFRTEIHNNLDVPVRIIKFGAYAFGDGSWQLANIGEEPYGSDDFTEWYQAGDTVVDGWIGTGEAAADSNNWIQSMYPMPSRFIWIYTAVDSAGTEYRAEAEIELLPVSNTGVPWRGVDPTRLIPVTGRLVLEDGSRPAYAQVHIYGINKHDRRPMQTVTVAGDGTFSLKAVRPGWYRLQIYCAGSERVLFPFSIDDSDETVEVAVYPVPHDHPAGRETAGPRVRFDDRHTWLQDLTAIERIYERENASFIVAMHAHEKEHEDLKGFRFDGAEEAALLGAYMKGEYPRAVREYAAVHIGMLRRVPLRMDTTTAREIFDTVSARSKLWGIYPNLASNIATTFKRSEGKKLLLGIVRENPDRLVRASTLANLARWVQYSGNREEVARYYEMLSGAYADVEEVQSTIAMLDPDRRVRAGELVPDFEIGLFDAEAKVSNKSLRGRYYLVYFWATWCGPCIKGMSHLHELFEKYHGGNFTILSLSLDKDRETVRRFRKKKWKMPWLHGFVEGGTVSEIAKAFEVFGTIPKIIFVDPEGVIVEDGYGACGVNLDETLKKHLDRRK